MIIKITPITEPGYEGMEARDIYLKSPIGKIIGLHAIGGSNCTWELVGLDGSRTQQTGFLAMDKWGNEYDENYKMLGRGSFRVHENIEELAKKFEDEGWISFERIS